MLAWWPLDESAGPIAMDVAGGHHASYIGAPAPESDGRVGGALRVDPGQLATAGGDFDFGTGDFSIDAWVKLGSVPSEAWIVQRGHEFHFAASAVGTEPHLEYDCGLAFWPDPIPVDTWTHLAVTVQRNTPAGLKKYVNGRLVGTQNTCAYNLSLPGVPLGLGNNGAYSRQHWLDEVEVFTRALAPAEVLAIYEARSGGKCKPYDPAKSACGNGILESDEECDDHNRAAGDGCSAYCRSEACSWIPQPACRSSVTPGQSQLQIADAAYPNDRKDQLKWKWNKGAATTLAELGDPSTTTSYVLCVYDNSQLVMSRAAPAGGDCGGKPCWRPSAKKVQYSDRLLTPSGIQKLTLSPGGIGKAKIALQARGQNLQSPSLPFAGPVTVQLVATDTGLCWGATFSPPFATNAVGKFKDKSD
jgi:cysteine-rich repeat protein